MIEILSSMEPETQKTDVQTQQVIKSSPSHLLVLFLVILGVAALSALGTYYYLRPQLQTPTLTPSYQQSTDQSNTNTDNAQQVTPVSGNIQGIEGWKTYTDDKQKYSIQYPPDWTVFPHIIGTLFPGYNGTEIKSSNKPDPHGERLALEGEAGIAITLSGMNKLSNETLLAYAKRTFTSPDTGGNLYTETTLNNLPAIKHIAGKSEPELGAITYMVANGSYVYSIDVDIKNTTGAITIDKILSTFKLTNQTQATPDDTAHSLIDAWLNSSKSLSTATHKRILDYTFTISKATLNGNVLQFQVDYSVKPVDINQTDWAAGNGKIDTTAGWIYHKFSFVLANNINGVYTITKMATSPL